MKNLIVIGRLVIAPLGVVAWSLRFASTLVYYVYEAMDEWLLRRVS